MKLGIMQPYFFPYIGYFQLINSVDRFLFYDDVNFIKQGWINRNRFLVNGKDTYFSIPVRNISSYKKINETEIDNSKKWSINAIKLFKFNYARAPFFNEIFPLIEEILCGNYVYISEISELSVKFVLKYLDIKTEVASSSMYYKDLKVPGQDRIISICLNENANEYINPAGGMDLYQKTEFEKNGIELKFIKSNPIEYRQFNNEFVPWLSIIDVLMFNPRTEIYKMLYDYKII